MEVEYLFLARLIVLVSESVGREDSVKKWRNSWDIHHHVVTHFGHRHSSRH